MRSDLHRLTATGLSACCSRYGDFDFASTFLRGGRADDMMVLVDIDLDTILESEESNMRCG